MKRKTVKIAKSITGEWNVYIGREGYCELSVFEGSKKNCETIKKAYLSAGLREELETKVWITEASIRRTVRRT